MQVLTVFAEEVRQAAEQRTATHTFSAWRNTLSVGFSSLSLDCIAVKEASACLHMNLLSRTEMGIITVLISCVSSTENRDTRPVVTRFWTAKHYFTGVFFLSKVSFYSLAIHIMKHEFYMPCQCWQTVNYISNDETSIILTFQKIKLQ